MIQTILWSDIRDYIEKNCSSDDVWAELYKTINLAVRSSTVVSFYYDEFETEADERSHLVDAMMQWISSTSTSKKALLSAYESAKDSLMKDVATTSRSWFNDAPSGKNADSSGEDLTHLTTFSKNTSESAYGTPMQRLRELDDSVLDVYRGWADDFIREFDMGREY